jgi:cytochrome c-type biogenesis protein CcmH
MRRLFRFSGLRFLQLGLVVLLAVFTMGAADNAVRYNDLGHKMMCVCGCGQILIECNHLGCQYSETELTELRTALHQGKGDTEILELFQTKYGPTVLAAPMLTKFNLVAWFVPPVVLLIGIAATIALVRKWRLRTVEMPAVPTTTTFQTARDRIRRETEL